GNAREGIFFSNSGTPDFAAQNVVQGNFIGTDITGTQNLGNGLRGITLLDSAGNSIGGTAAGAGNLISGNGAGAQAGIPPGGANTQFNLVQGNFIGTDASGTAPLGGAIRSSNGSGIEIADGAANNTIGGPVAVAGNTIAYNAGVGVLIFNATAAATTGNRI